MNILKKVLVFIFVKKEHVALAARELTPENASEEEAEAIMHGIDRAFIAKCINEANPHSFLKPHLQRAWATGYAIGMLHKPNNAYCHCECST